MASPLKKVAKRSWVGIRDHWLGFLPDIDFDSGIPSPTLWDLPDFDRMISGLTPEEVTPYIAGVREAIFREGLILTRKHIYCWSVAKQIAGAQKHSWTAIAAYDASFFGAKAFCYFLGIASLGRDSRLYLDAFRETTRRFKKENVTSVDLIAHDLKSRFEHSVLWSMVERLLNTVYFDAELATVQSMLRQIDWPGFSRFRNKLMYNGAFWPLSESYSLCDLAHDVCHIDIYESVCGFGSVVTPFANEYFLAGRLFRKALYLMMLDIAALAPAFEREASALK